MNSWQYFPLVLHLVLAVLAAKEDSIRVGIIGAGIGGGATAYYLTKFSRGVPMEITVFEKNDYIGGRLKHITFENATFEVGGDAFSNVNEYVYEISQDLGLSYDDSGSSGNGLTGLWDGTQWYPIQSQNYLDDAKLYGLMEYLRARLYANYLERGNSVTFNTIEEFLGFGGLDTFASVSSKQMAAKYGVNDRVMWGAWEPLSRVIFDQGLDCNAFAGFTVLLSAGTDSFTILGGNSLLPQGMLDVSGAKVNLNTQVNSISGNPDGSFTVQTQSNGVKQSAEFDYVVIAAPIEFANITFQNLKIPKFQPREYHHWFVTYVSATDLNPNYFGVSPVPDIIFTPSNSSAPFNIIAVQDNTTDGYKIYKIFSNVDVSGDLGSMFLNVRNTFVQYWPYTFPDLAPTTDYQPIQLSDNLFYLNTIESLAVAMGASTPAGRNAALLILNEWFSR